jgi:YjjW family glycine radical enzyme activase
VNSGLVTDTITFSSVDGPGNRFVVFLQGCNFDCVACHNPYTINVCTDCGECVEQCPSGALTISSGIVQWAESECIGGDSCLAACPYDSSPKARPREVASLLADIRRAAPFLSGVTVSGGEATQQHTFVRELFSAVKADATLARLTCFVDSNGAAAPEVWESLAPVMDGAMIDLKCLDPVVHERMTGQPNAAVLASIVQLHALGKLHEVRLLLLAGVNDDRELLRRTGEWLAAVDRTMRVKVIGFRLHGARAQTPPLVEPGPEGVAAAADVLRSVAPFDIVTV